MGKGESRPREQITRLCEGKLQCDGKSQHGGLAGRVLGIAAYLGEQPPVYVCPTVDFYVFSAGRINQPQECCRERLVKVANQGAKIASCRCRHAWSKHLGYDRHALVDRVLIGECLPLDVKELPPRLAVLLDIVLIDVALHHAEQFLADREGFPVEHHKSNIYVLLADKATDGVGGNAECLSLWVSPNSRNMELGDFYFVCLVIISSNLLTESLKDPFDFFGNHRFIKVVSLYCITLFLL